MMRTVYFQLGSKISISQNGMVSTPDNEKIVSNETSLVPAGFPNRGERQRS